MRRAAGPLWLVAAALALAGVVWAIGRVADEHLKVDAEHTAIAWANFVVRVVPELDSILGGELPSERAREQLEGVRTASNVFRFKFFAPDGRLLLVSDSLGSRPDPAAGGGFSNPTAATIALGGGNYIKLEDHGDGVKRPRVYSEAYVPIKRNGRLIGVVEVYVDQTERAATVSASFRRVVAAVGAALVALLAFGGWLWRGQLRHERAAEERVRYLAHHDVLTGALNRASFQDALQLATRHHGRADDSSLGFAVLCIDLDHFKDVNDSLGHAAGDELLRQLTVRLRGVLRNADLVARLGGDEFAVLQSGVDSSDSVATLAERIVQALGQPYELAGQRCVCSASVGAAIRGIDGADAEGLMHRADLALYRAKTNGRAGYSFYDPGLDRDLQNRRALTRDLRDALANGSLVLHFQPLFGGDGQTLCGYEALARWPHPTRGFVPPLEFIPLAEETGLIDELGRWVLNAACTEAARWPAPLSVAVNLSPAQFRREGAIIDEINAALQAAGLPADRLEVEITESLLMSNTEPVLRTLNTLHTMGVRIAMDDFGTGHSSLAYLWRFPFDKVKIDRAFTQNLVDDDKVDLIVRSIVSLAHSLDIRVNAEGVETASQMAALREHGCDELQGYLLGRPGPADRLPHDAVVAAAASDAAVAAACS